MAPTFLKGDASSSASTRRYDGLISCSAKSAWWECCLFGDCWAGVSGRRCKKTSIHVMNRRLSRITQGGTGEPDEGSDARGAWMNGWVHSPVDPVTRLVADFAQWKALSGISSIGYLPFFEQFLSRFDANGKDDFREVKTHPCGTFPPWFAVGKTTAVAVREMLLVEVLIWRLLDVARSLSFDLLTLGHDISPARPSPT